MNSNSSNMNQDKMSNKNFRILIKFDQAKNLVDTQTETKNQRTDEYSFDDNSGYSISGNFARKINEKIEADKLTEGSYYYINIILIYRKIYS